MKPSAKQSIDHPVIAVADMAKARTAYERLGFIVPPRGRHLEWGTGNWCIMFESDYLELRGIVDPAKETHGLDSFLAKQGEGLMGVALATDDADASHEELVSRGLHPQRVRRLTRAFELPEGTVEPRFALCFLNAQDAPGLMSVVLCQHLTPQLLRRPEWLRHENAAAGVLSMTGVVQDIDAAEKAHRRLFGAESVTRHGNLVTIQAGPTQTIQLTVPDEIERLHPGLDRSYLPSDGLVCVTLKSADFRATTSRLTSKGIRIAWQTQDRLRVAREEACGLALEFSA
jgi:catechol 2,3-dioxygenase-like lactoylglutathione lyase family enzyme